MKEAIATYLIPYAHEVANSELTGSRPHKLVLYTDYLECYSWFTYNKENKETGIVEEVLIDYHGVVKKSGILSIYMKFSNDVDKYAVLITATEPECTFFFDEKKDAKELFGKLISWWRS